MVRMPGDNFFTAENVVAIVLAIIVVIIFTIPVILLFLSENTNAELATPATTTIVHSLVANRLNASPIDTPNSFFTNAPPFQIFSAPKTRSRSRSTLIIPSPFRGSPPTGVTQTPRPILNAKNLNFNNSNKSTKNKKHRRSSKA